MSAQHKFTVPVRELAAFGCQYGDIDSRYLPSPTAQEGTEGHQLVAKRRGKQWQREVSVKRVFTRHSVELTVRGRVDLVNPDQQRVEEIKTTRVDVSELPARAKALHLAQVETYGALLAHEHDWAEVTLIQTWLDLRDEQEQQQTHSRQASELIALLEQRIDAYCLWLSQLSKHKSKSLASIRELTFPYSSYRPGQRQLAVSCWRAMEHQRTLIAEAPTGIGKTLAVMVPAIRAIERGWHDGVLFLTARNVGRLAALDSLEILRKQGLMLRPLTLTGRDKLCLSPDSGCTPDECPYAAGYYQRLAAQRNALLELDSWVESQLIAFCQAHRLCPHYLQFELLPWSDLVIGDLNYVFNARGSVSPLLLEFNRKPCLLIDEAHNLLPRARELYSAGISKSALLAVQRETQNKTELKRALQGVNRQLNALAKQEQERETVPDKLLTALHRLTEALQAHWAAHAQPPMPEQLELLFTCQRFIETAAQFGPHYQLELESHSKNLTLSLRCQDPAPLLSQRWQEAQSSVLFSATLSPLNFTQQTLGISSESPVLQLPSPFAPQQMPVLITRDLDVRYSARQSAVPVLSQLISSAFRSKPGNWLVFFPSFAFLSQVAEQLPENLPLVQQIPGMNEEERLAFISAVSDQTPRVGLAVLSGLFAEGLDLPGEQLIGVIVVGTGLPQFNPRNEKLKAYYQQRYPAPKDAGFDFTYRFPGMQKVIQAAGRLIRTDTDRGIVILADQRFLTVQQRLLLPQHWQWHPINCEQTASFIDEFWA